MCNLLVVLKQRFKYGYISIDFMEQEEMDIRVVLAQRSTELGGNQFWCARRLKRELLGISRRKMISLEHLATKIYKVANVDMGYARSLIQQLISPADKGMRRIGYHPDKEMVFRPADDGSSIEVSVQKYGLG